jgi:hypothetical protein
LGVTTFATKVTSIGNAENHDGGNMNTLPLPARPYTSSLCLPPYGSEEKEGLPWVFEGNSQSIFEKDSQ